MRREAARRLATGPSALTASPAMRERAVAAARRTECVRVLERAGQGALRARGGPAGERGGGGAGDAAIRVRERHRERRLGPLAGGEPEEQRRAAADDRARVARAPPASAAPGPTPARPPRAPRAPPPAPPGARPRARAAASSARERLLEPGQRAEQRGLHLGLGLAPERGGEERRRRLRPERLERAHGARAAARRRGAESRPSSARTGRGPRGWRAAPSSGRVAAGEPIRPANRPRSREARATGRPARHGGGRRAPSARRPRGAARLPAASTAAFYARSSSSLPAQLGDEAGQVRAASSGRLAVGAGRAGEPGPLDEPRGSRSRSPSSSLTRSESSAVRRRRLAAPRSAALSCSSSTSRRRRGRRRPRSPAPPWRRAARELRLQLRDAALEEHDLLERAAQELLRLDDGPRPSPPRPFARP